jgi:hypothetical protein
MDPAVVPAAAPAAMTFEDGLGQRLRVVDPMRNEPVDMLCLRGELTAVPAFEFALRERVSRLAAFRHPCFAAVHSVERLKDRASTLALVSDSTAGVRLSEILAFADREHAPLDIDAALCLLRQVVAAAAKLHEHASDVAHGAIAPERLVATPGARVVIVEHVLGSALEQLRLSHERYWRELRLALPRCAGAPRFDHRADATQIGIVALSLILSRPLADDEYPARVGEVVASTWAISARGGLEPLPAGLRAWLMRSLQLDPRNGFRSAIEAQDDLERVLGETDYLAAPASLEAFLASYHQATAAAAVEAAPDSPAPVSVTPPAPIAATKIAATASPAKPLAAPAPVAPVVSEPASGSIASGSMAAPVASAPTAAPPIVGAPIAPPQIFSPSPVQPTTPAATPHVNSATSPVQPIEPAAAPSPRPAPAGPIEASRPSSVASSTAAPPAPAHPKETALPSANHDPSLSSWPPPSRHDQPQTHDAPTSSTLRKRWPLAAAAIALLAVAAAGVPVARRYVSTSPAASASGTLNVNTNPQGAHVFVDGVERGVTPLTVALKPGAHGMELRVDDAPPRTMPITITAGGQLAQYIDLPKTAATVGQLHVRTDPAGARVTVDGVAHGTSPVTIADLTPGEHAIVLDSDLGSVKQSVTIEAGLTASLTVPLTAAEGAPVSGWIAVTAPADVQVFENKRLIGTSQSDRLMMAAGRHDLEIVNETLGYHAARTVQVGPGRVTPIRIDFPKGTIALNAIPWAEVWVDGVKVGETPIGNLQLTIGPHDIVFRNPDLGEQRHAATITVDTPARLSVDLRKK